MDQNMDKISCPRCGTEHPASAFFCNDCGIPLKQNPVLPVNQPYQQPYCQPYQQPYPVIYPAPVKTPGKGFGIAAMVLGIIGLIYAFAFFSGVISVLEYYNNYDYEYYGYVAYNFNMSILMGVIMISVMPTLGIIFGYSARRRGYKNGISTSGIVTGSIGCALILIALLICMM